MEGHVGDVLSCRFFPSGEVVLSAGSDLQMKIWSVSDGVSPATLKGHTGGVTDTAIVSRGRNVLCMHSLNHQQSLFIMDPTD